MQYLYQGISYLDSKVGKHLHTFNSLSDVSCKYVLYAFFCVRRAITACGRWESLLTRSHYQPELIWSCKVHIRIFCKNKTHVLSAAIGSKPFWNRISIPVNIRYVLFLITKIWQKFWRWIVSSKTVEDFVKVLRSSQDIWNLT